MKKTQTNKARVLILDLETAPALVYTFGLRDQNHGIDAIKRDSYVLMWCARWLGENKALSDTLINYPKDYKKDPTNDRNIAISLQKLLDEANLVVTQNGNSFDLKWSNTLFLKHGLEEPSHYYSVDLLLASRRSYYSLSHRLDFRGRQLGLGGKMEHEGFKLWIKVMDGDKSAWKRMLDYCNRDVKLTEEYYLKLRPRIKNHPNVNVFHNQPFGGRLKCPACGSGKLKRKGWRYLISGRKQRFKCDDCGSYALDTVRPDTETKALLKSEN